MRDTMTALEGLRLLTAWVFFLKNLEIYNWWVYWVRGNLKVYRTIYFHPFFNKAEKQ